MVNLAFSWAKRCTCGDSHVQINLRVWITRVFKLIRYDREIPWKQSFYLIHHVSKVIVCTLRVNQNTLKTTEKEKFTNNAIYSNDLSLC